MIRNFQALAYATMLIIICALPSALMLEAAFVPRTTETPKTDIEKSLGYLLFFVVCIIAHVNGQVMLPSGDVAYVRYPSNIFFMVVLFGIILSVPQRALHFYIAMYFVYAVFHPRGRILRMWRRRTRTAWVPFTRIYKLMAATMLPGLVLLQLGGILTLTLTKNRNICNWFPGMTMFSHDKACAPLARIIPVVGVSFVFAVLSVWDHTIASSVMTGIMGGPHAYIADRKMKALEDVLSSSVVWDTVKVDPVMSVRDLSALVSGNVITSDKQYMINSEEYQDSLRKSGLDRLLQSTEVHSAIVQYGGQDRRFALQDVVNQLVKKGKDNDAAKDYRWFELGERSTGISLNILLSPPTMQYTFEDIYEASYYIRMLVGWLVDLITHSSENK
jgi:hypothetical protein